MANPSLLRRCVYMASAATLVSGEGVSAAQVADTPVPAVAIEQLALLEGGPDGPFGEITDVAWTDLGHVVVLDRIQGQVSAFTASGAHLWTTGTVGEGPGELSNQSTDVSHLPGGRVLVTDPGNLRASVWDSAGTFLEFIPLQVVETVGVVRTLEPVGDDWMLAEALSVRSDEGSTGFRLTLWALDAEGAPLREVHSFEDVPANISRDVGGQISMRMVPVASLWAVDPDGRVGVGRSDRYRFAEVTDSAVELRAARDVRARAVSSREREEALSKIPPLPSNVRIAQDDVHPLTGKVLFDRSLGDFGYRAGWG